MISEQSKSIAQAAQQLYESQLRDKMERAHHGKYLCIEPISGDYFLGDTLDQAVNAALDSHPDRLTQTIRIGVPAALHLGVLFQ